MSYKRPAAAYLYPVRYDNSFTLFLVLHISNRCQIWIYFRPEIACTSRPRTYREILFYYNNIIRYYNIRSHNNIRLFWYLEFSTVYFRTITFSIYNNQIRNYIIFVTDFWTICEMNSKDLNSKTRLILRDIQGRTWCGANMLADEPPCMLYKMSRVVSSCIILRNGHQLRKRVFVGIKYYYV